MKFEIPILTSLLTRGNDLVARAAIQGIEQALLWAVVNSSMGRLKAAARILRSRCGIRGVRSGRTRLRSYDSEVADLENAP
jgi:hypothetical protein